MSIFSQIYVLHLNHDDYRNQYATIAKTMTSTVELPLKRRGGNQDGPGVKKAQIKIIMSRHPDFYTNVEIFEKLRQETKRKAAETGQVVKSTPTYGFKKQFRSEYQESEQTSASSSAQKLNLDAEAAC